MKIRSQGGYTCSLNTSSIWKNKSAGWPGMSEEAAEGSGGPFWAVLRNHCIELAMKSIQHSQGIKGWYWPQGLLSMPTDNSHKFWETPSDKTSVSSVSKSDFLTSSIVIPGQCNFSCSREEWMRRVLGASKPRPSAKGAYPYRKRACLEALRLATTKCTQRGTGYPSWEHTIQLRISRGSTGLIHKWQLRRERGQWIQV